MKKKTLVLFSPTREQSKDSSWATNDFKRSVRNQTKGNPSFDFRPVHELRSLNYPLERSSLPYPSLKHYSPPPHHLAGKK